MAYYLFLADMVFPVAPSELSVAVSSKNKTVNLINEGEINIIKKAGLKEISFEALLPNSPYPFADYSTSLAGAAISALGKVTGFSSYTQELMMKPAEYYLQKLETAKLDKIPLRFIVSRTTPNGRVLFSTNMAVTVEDYTMRESANEGFDVIVPIRLKEYRHYGTKEIVVVKDKDGKEVLKVVEPRQSVKEVPKNYLKVTKEKSIYEAVKNATGDGLNWRSVASNNGITNPCGVTPKAVLKL